jgi:hypothetical protein
MRAAGVRREVRMLTHTVVNQVPPRVDVNEFATHAALVDAVRHYDAGWALGELQGIGALVGTEEFQRDAETANTNVPTLATHDRYGNRIDEVRYDSAYHAVIAQARTLARGRIRRPARTSRGPPRSCCLRRSSRGMPARSR